MAPDVRGLQQLDWKGPRGRFNRERPSRLTDRLMDRADRQPGIQIGRQTDRETATEIDRTTIKTQFFLLTVIGNIN